MAKRLIGAWIGAVALCAGLVAFLPSDLRAADSAGTEFWLAFEANGATGVLSLQILGESGTTGSVDVAGLGFSAPFSIPAGGITTVVLPAAAALSTADGVEALGVHVTASKAVVVYGLDINAASADSYLALPVPALGMAYDAVSYTPGELFSSQLAVVATADGTQVTLTPTATIGSHPPNVEFAVALDAGQVYQAQSSGDLTGTRIVADHPVAVLSGNPWVYVPLAVGFADHLVEQLLPTASWGTDVFVVPSALRTAEERLRIQASLPNTLVTTTSGGSYTFGPGGYVEITFGEPLRLESLQPFSVSHFATGGSSDEGAGDPYLLVPLAVERFASCYLVATADDGTIFPDNFVSLVVPSDALGQVLLDGAPIPAGSFTEIATTGFFQRQLAVAPGRHRVDGPLAFGAGVYGFGDYVSYGSPAGGASPPFPAGFAECAPEPTSCALGIGAGAAVATLARRTRRLTPRRSRCSQPRYPSPARAPSPCTAAPDTPSGSARP